MSKSCARCLPLTLATEGERLARCVEPPVALQWSESAIFVPERLGENRRPASAANIAKRRKVTFKPDGWKISAPSANFHLTAPGEQSEVSFELTPPSRRARNVGSHCAGRRSNRRHIRWRPSIIRTFLRRVVPRPARKSARRRAILAKTIGYSWGGHEVRKLCRSWARRNVHWRRRSC